MALARVASYFRCALRRRRKHFKQRLISRLSSVSSDANDDDATDDGGGQHLFYGRKKGRKLQFYRETPPPPPRDFLERRRRWQRSTYFRDQIDDPSFPPFLTFHALLCRRDRRMPRIALPYLSERPQLSSGVPGVGFVYRDGRKSGPKVA